MHCIKGTMYKMYNVLYEMVESSLTPRMLFKAHKKVN